MEPQPVNDSTPTPQPAVDLTLLIPAVVLGVKEIIAAASASRDARNALVVADNVEQLKLWNKAVWLEGALILAVLLGGFGACIAFALSGQTGSAEKVAFALFGFIGGRGFLNIRTLINASAKRDGS